MLAVAASELTLALGALALLVWGAFQGRTNIVFTIAASGLLIAAAVVAATAPLGSLFSGALISDKTSALAKVVIYLASAVSIPLGEAWLNKRGDGRFEYAVLVVIAALGMGMMVSAGDLISLYISIELQSLALYVLAAFRRDDGKSSEAALKYFVLGALSSGMLLYGASLIYGFAGSTHFADIAKALAGGAGNGALFGLVFLLTGIAFKVSAAPFHMWTPDVYEGAPTPIVGFFAGAPKLAAMVLMARVLLTAFGGAHEQWRQVLVVLALLSVAVGAFAGLVQTNLKRLWAYSSIATIGYALVGLASGGADGAQSTLMFMIFYVVDVTGFFACLTALTRDGKSMETIADFSGLVRERPGLALALTAFCVSAIGIPGFTGFFGKYYVFKAAVNASLAPVAVAALVGSVIAAFYYLRLIKVMWLDEAPSPTDTPARGATLAAYGSALLAFPLMMLALASLDPLTRLAATALVGR
jgi:NADH-quinone oxidoreductase subunit N